MLQKLIIYEDENPNAGDVKDDPDLEDLVGLSLEDLVGVNLFAGRNNVGKSLLLRKLADQGDALDLYASPPSFPIGIKKDLSAFDDNLELNKIIWTGGWPKFMITMKREKRTVELNKLGKGINKFVDILIKLRCCRGTLVALDDIDSGIHYENFELLWRLIFQQHIDFGTQIFASTHSLECIEAFSHTCTELNDRYGAYFELARNVKTEKVIAIRRDPDQLRFCITSGLVLPRGKIRGEPYCS